MSTETAARMPDDLRNDLVDRLLRWRAVRTDSVEMAMRTVPRHLFLPGVPVEDAYANEAVVTHRDAEGVAVSSASAPGIVAAMLEQLDVRAGHRVLEIGAGTGYNAALLAHLAGPAGAVTTVDIDEAVVEGARRGLSAAGLGHVRVVHGDGEYGCADGSPYDRLIATVGAWDLPPAWLDQVAPQGRIVVPLRMRGLTRSVALERQGGFWRSCSAEVCGFVPMRGVGGVAERNIKLGDSGLLRVDDGQPVDAEALRRAMDGPPSAVSWTGVTAMWDEFSDLEFLLAGMDGFCRFIAMGTGTELVPPMYKWGSMAVHDAGTFAYLTLRQPVQADDVASQDIFELGVCAYGPEGEALAYVMADRIRLWSDARRMRGRSWIEVHPAGSAIDVAAGDLVIDKAHTRVIVRTK